MAKNVTEENRILVAAPTPLHRLPRLKPAGGDTPLLHLAAVASVFRPQENSALPSVCTCRASKMRVVACSASLGISSRHLSALLLLLLLTSAARVDPTTLDCPLRQLLLDSSQQIQPFRPLSAFQAIADALNGAPEANNCSVAPNPHLLRTAPFPACPPLSAPLPHASALHVLVDCFVGSDGQHADGSPQSPFRTVHAALLHIRSLRASAPPSQLPPAVISLSRGVHYLLRTLLLTPADSNLTIIGHAGLSALSGGIPVDSAADPLTWAPVAPPPPRVRAAPWRPRRRSVTSASISYCSLVIPPLPQVSTACPRRR